MFGVVRHRESAVITLAVLQSIRKARPDGEPILAILDNPSAYKGPRSGAGQNVSGSSCVHTNLYVVGEPNRSAFRTIPTMLC